MTTPYISHHLTTTQILQSYSVMQAEHVRILVARLREHSEAVHTLRELLPHIEASMRRGELAQALVHIDAARDALRLIR